MALRIIGAGVGRTGTLSLKAAFEQVLGGNCYHMIEVFTHPEHVPLWQEAATGEIEWDTMMGDFVATADFPACLFWRELLARNPEAIVVLSTRRDAQVWWASASQTIFTLNAAELPPDLHDWFQMWSAVAAARFTDRWTDERAACAAYERHNADVRASVPPDRLVDWSPGDGWEPICRALGVPVPDAPFPHLNTRQDFPSIRDRGDLDDALEQMRSAAHPGPDGGAAPLGLDHA
jgi:hypothetical protein